MSDQTLKLSDSLLKSVIAKIKKKLEKKEVEGQAKGGKIRVIMSGTQDVLRVLIAENLPADREHLQELVVEATNEAINKTKALLKLELEQVLGNRPWLDELF